MLCITSPFLWQILNSMEKIMGERVFEYQSWKVFSHEFIAVNESITRKFESLRGGGTTLHSTVIFSLFGHGVSSFNPTELN